MTGRPDFDGNLDTDFLCNVQFLYICLFIFVSLFYLIGCFLKNNLSFFACCCNNANKDVYKIPIDRKSVV